MEGATAIAHRLEGVGRSSPQTRWRLFLTLSLAAAHRPGTGLGLPPCKMQTVAQVSLQLDEIFLSFLPPGSFRPFCSPHWTRSWMEPPKELFHSAQAHQPHIQPSFLGCFPQVFPVQSRLFRERFAGNDAILESQTCPDWAPQELWSCSLAPYTSLVGWKQQKLYKRRPFSQPPDEPWARKDPQVLWKRAQRPIYKPFYLSTCKRKGTCSGAWLAFSHPPPTYNNQVSPRFPQERCTWKRLLIAQLPREVLALGSVAA